MAERLPGAGAGLAAQLAAPAARVEAGFRLLQPARAEGHVVDDAGARGRQRPVPVDLQHRLLAAGIEPSAWKTQLGVPVFVQAEQAAVVVQRLPAVCAGDGEVVQAVDHVCARGLCRASAASISARISSKLFSGWLRAELGHAGHQRRAAAEHELRRRRGAAEFAGHRLQHRVEDLRCAPQVFLHLGCAIAVFDAQHPAARVHVCGQADEGRDLPVAQQVQPRQSMHVRPVGSWRGAQFA
ncbi:MAG TPA: hypothetical protein PKB14_05000 [Rubrivivax sp.]|nr:hypothetical protein [Rubrivivax sp.]